MEEGIARELLDEIKGLRAEVAQLREALQRVQRPTPFPSLEIDPRTAASVLGRQSHRRRRQTGSGSLFKQ